MIRDLGLFEHVKEDARVFTALDYTSCFRALKAQGLRIDYHQLQLLLRSHLKGKQIRFYTPYHEDIDPSGGLKRLIDWIEYHGYVMREPGAKESDIPVAMAIDLMAIRERVDHLIVMSGRAELGQLVRRLADEGIDVTVIHSRLSDRHSVSDILRREAASFIDFSQFKGTILKDARASSVQNPD